MGQDSYSFKDKLTLDQRLEGGSPCVYLEKVVLSREANRPAWLERREQEWRSEWWQTPGSWGLKFRLKLWLIQGQLRILSREITSSTFLIRWIILVAWLRVDSRGQGWQQAHWIGGCCIDPSDLSKLIPQTRMLTEVVASGLYLEGKPSLVSWQIGCGIREREGWLWATDLPDQKIRVSLDLGEDWRWSRVWDEDRMFKFGDAESEMPIRYLWYLRIRCLRGDVE